MHVLGMPPAFVLSQDQTLKFIPGRLPSTPIKGLHNARINARAMAARAAARASLPTFSTLSINNPQRHARLKGAALISPPLDASTPYFGAGRKGLDDAATP